MAPRSGIFYGAFRATDGSDRWAGHRSRHRAVNLAQLSTNTAEYAPLQALATILTPVVIVTSSAILANGMLTMYASVNDRMRAMVAERLEILGPDLRPPQGARDTERMRELDRQLPVLLHRHRLLRDAVWLTYLAIATVVASMFLVAIAVTTGESWVATAALWVLLCGSVLVAGGLLQTLRAVRRSDDAVDGEVRRVLGLD